ncbi:MAG: hypothetical protein R3C05_21365 [Pirellulaceae bacterium]
MSTKGTLGLYGQIALSELGTLNRSGGTVELAGTLDLEGGNWNLDASTGSWHLAAGQSRTGRSINPMDRCCLPHRQHPLCRTSF